MKVDYEINQEHKNADGNQQKARLETNKPPAAVFITALMQVYSITVGLSPTLYC